MRLCKHWDNFANKYSMNEKKKKKRSDSALHIPQHSKMHGVRIISRNIYVYPVYITQDIVTRYKI